MDRAIRTFCSTPAREHLALGRSMRCHTAPTLFSSRMRSVGVLAGTWEKGDDGRFEPGSSLADWRRRMEKPVPPIGELLGKRFRELPEHRSYPLAGLLVQVAIERLGIAKVREHPRVKRREQPQPLWKMPFKPADHSE